MAQAPLAVELDRFLKQQAVDPLVVEYVVKELRIESVHHFASRWAPAEYQEGVKNEVVAKVLPFGSDLSRPTSKLQVARLRTAWKLAAESVEAGGPTGGQLDKQALGEEARGGEESTQAPKAPVGCPAPTAGDGNGREQQKVPAAVKVPDPEKALPSKKTTACCGCRGRCSCCGCFSCFTKVAAKRS
mmetsp:Transcript_64170/g.206727  ORF Transcript_64170/g.206727 Transcript_64170/m.206727 type:complete len:187 (+) Transcript_64170:63-623(+)